MQERLLIFDDLDGDVALLLVVVCLDHLPEGALADKRVYLVAIEKPLSRLDDVVMVFVVVTLKFGAKNIE